MKMKNIIIPVTVVIALYFSGCSESDGSSSTTTTTLETNPVSIAITAACISNTPDTETYQEIVAGDEIIKDEENTVVNIVVDSTGVQKVCLERGAAHILR